MSQFIDWSHEPDPHDLARAIKILKRDPSTAIAKFESMAQRGSPTSMLYIGYLYRAGIGRAVDLKEAERWYGKAADLGSIRAYYSLGTLYLNLKRPQEAKDVLAIAAAKDYGPALNRLGRMYVVGTGVEKNLERARQYLERASAAGNVFGRAGLSLLLLRHRFGMMSKLRGLFLYFTTYFVLVRTICTEGFSSDRLRY